MGRAYWPDYWFFQDYQDDVLSPLSRTEQISLLDSEIVNKYTMSRYQNGLEPNEWPQLHEYYSQLFADFVTERIKHTTDATPIQENRSQFDEFRQYVADVNQKLSHNQTRSKTTISKPAERILLKELRQSGYDPSTLDVSHIARGGGLYLLELFVTAARQEAYADTDYLTKLLNTADELQNLTASAARDALTRPVLMVSLWDNQETGLKRWLADGREGILEMATATGKTVAGIAAIAHLCGELPQWPDQTRQTENANIMIVAHSNAILSQWKDEITDKLGLASSSLSGSGDPDNLDIGTGTVEFHTANWLLPQYDRDLEDMYDLVIYDEVHHYSNESGFGQAIQRPNYEAAMGLSATIGEEDSAKRRKLEQMLAPVVYTYDVEDASRDGIIPDFEWTVHPTALDPEERTEWEETTESITNQFRYLQNSSETESILKKISVPFTRLDDLGDFIQAYQAAQVELPDELPDEWTQLHSSIQSRNWIRHRSQPKLEGALDLAKEYLTEVEQGVKLVMFAMDIETTEAIGDALSEITDDVYMVHSQIASSSKKKDRMVRRRIDEFAEADHGVLIAPKLLDEGIDVPDAEVGINVAGTKTKLQLVQRMGRVLRKHGEQEPHFHHFVAVPDEHHLDGLDGRQYVQELNWVRELGEAIGEQPRIEQAAVDSDVLDRAEQRGHELWARELLSEFEVETVQGSVELEELISSLTLSAARTILKTVDLDNDELVKSDWGAAMTLLRSDDSIGVEQLQQIWWLFPLYQSTPSDLKRLLDKVIKKRPKPESETDTQQPSNDREGNQQPSSSDDLVTAANEGQNERSDPSTQKDVNADKKSSPPVTDESRSQTAQETTPPTSQEDSESNPQQPATEDDPDEDGIVSKIASWLMSF